MTADRELARGRCTTPRRPSARWRCASAPPQVLQRLGVHVIDAEPEDLPVALTDHYLLLKSRGLLDCLKPAVRREAPADAAQPGWSPASARVDVTGRPTPVRPTRPAVNT